MKIFLVYIRRRKTIIFITKSQKVHCSEKCGDYPLFEIENLFINTRAISYEKIDLRMDELRIEIYNQTQMDRLL